MFRALTKAFGQFDDPRFRRVLWQAIGLSVLTFVLLWIVAGAGLGWLAAWLGDWLAGYGWAERWTGALEWLFGGAGVVGLLAVSFFLFPAGVAIAMTLLLERIAEAVEARHYPELGPAREVPLGESLWSGLSFLVTLALLNLLALPLYLALLFLPPFNLILFYLLNGYLLGREYLELVALRRMELGRVKRLRRRHRGTILLGGITIAVLLTVPLVNFVTPILATAFMLHLFESLRPRAGLEGA